jgi:hemerythrin-like domain-containing protein
MITSDRLSTLESMLAGDHHRLDCAFQGIVTRAQGGDAQALAAEWFAFQNALLRHLEAEERHLLPALAADRPGEAQALRDEHESIRIKLLQLGIDLDLHCLRTEHVEAFVEALRAHAHREENIFYPWVDRRLGGC